jgi:hypothetical protein
MPELYLVRAAHRPGGGGLQTGQYSTNSHSQQQPARQGLMTVTLGPCHPTQSQQERHGQHACCGRCFIRAGVSIVAVHVESHEVNPTTAIDTSVKQRQPGCVEKVSPAEQQGKH